MSTLALLRYFMTHYEEKLKNILQLAEIPLDETH